MVSWAPRLPPAVSGSGMRCGRVCLARVSAVPSPSWLGCRGVFFALLFFLFFFSGLCGPCPSICFLSGWAGGSLFFFFGVPLPRGPLLLTWCCRFWVGGPPVPLWGSCLPCLLGGGVGRLWWCWRAVWRLWAVFVPFPPPPPLFFGGGGLACSSLCLPWAGARTGLHSVLSSGLLSSVAFCVAAFRPHGSGGLCTRWARRPFLSGQVLALPAGRLRQAAACGFGLGSWGCSCPFPSAVPAVIFWVVRHRCRGHTAEHFVRSAVVTCTEAELRPRTIKVPGNGCIHVRRHLSSGGTGQIPPRAGNDFAPPVDHGIKHERMPAVGGFVNQNSSRSTGCDGDWMATCVLSTIADTWR